MVLVDPILGFLWTTFGLGIVTSLHFLQVQWNARGQPIKHKNKDFASFVGVTVLHLVPIANIGVTFGMTFK
ncbi:transmembrane protein, putative [Medicago truncatula]|uniref:Transmembrane protein, putative n=1 Tax=Medicago truncatula TaxID=3880 RepID=A0A072V6D4_MEDTR|nr:transmembrane protein, putative [Medicago truncatula]